MPAEPTDSSRYRSRFAPDTYVTAAQWLAESMCERIAKRDKTVLPMKFWTIKRWARTFVLQVTHANKLLKEFDVAAIIAALKTTDGKRAYSFGGAWLKEIIAHEQAKLNNKPVPTHTPPPPPLENAEPPRDRLVSSKSTFAKLKELESNG